MAQYTKMVKQENGDTVEFTVMVVDSGCVSNDIDFYIRSMRVKPKGKRKWDSVDDALEGTYEFRRMSAEAKELHRMKTYLQYVTPQQIKEAVMYAYESLWPHKILNLLEKAAEEKGKE